MQKKRIFIGSSSEELELAERAKDILQEEFEVTIWNENVWDKSVFKLNQNFLSSLLKATLKFDYGILLGTKDDKVKYRLRTVLQPRDNILFELGLFLGRMGTEKCAFVIDKKIKLLSDFQGITLARFNRKDLDSFDRAIEQVKDLFKNSDGDDINFFPSSTLAEVYFQNLIVPICKHIKTNRGFEYNDIHYENCTVNVLIPSSIQNDVNIQFEGLKNNYKTQPVDFKYEGRPRKISIDTQIKDNRLTFIDFPTIISGINYAIQVLLPDEFRKGDADYNLIINRELERFLSNLQKKLERNGFDSIVKIVRT